MKARTTH